MFLSNLKATSCILYPLIPSANIAISGVSNYCRDIDGSSISSTLSVLRAPTMYLPNSTRCGRYLVCRCSNVFTLSMSFMSLTTPRGAAVRLWNLCGVSLRPLKKSLPLIRAHFNFTGGPLLSGFAEAFCFLSIYRAYHSLYISDDLARFANTRSGLCLTLR